ncbi:MATE family efflux transporter [Sphingomonas sp. AOB5]|uniref:MATE family efflux transporter n=1 Tax=Sphingomonas sp. AOB5 TaxID=3034017 RepID=UPI0023F9C47F|nr:MATE family efflux transporter [Sphingomonas sp. AOB5]MDF7774260.1 MATE family efflux transporter [Sphingomonas sp. AOB5]
MRASPALIAETRKLLALAWPVMLTSLNWTILHVTDVIVVGMTGTGEVAYLGASRSLTFIGIVIAIGALSGILVHVSRADGAKDLPGTGRVFHEGLLLAAALGLASMVILFTLAQPMLIGLGVDAHVAPGAAHVVQVMAFAYPFQLMIVAASFFLEGVSKPRRVAVVNLSILPVNAVLAWAMSGGHLGFPVMGAAGAAAATAIASALGAIGMLAAAWMVPEAKARGVRALNRLWTRETRAGALALAKFGFVPGLASGLELAGFSILIALSTQLGDVTTHAFQIVFSIHNLTFSIALGLGSAAGVRAGNAVGEGVPEQAAWRTGIAAGLAAIALGLQALVLLVIPAAVVGLFPAIPPVHVLAAAMLIPWAPFILFDGVQVVLVYALRSLGDQVAAGVNSIIAFFVITGGAGLWLVHTGWGAYGLAIASGIGMLAAAALHGARLLVVNRRFRSQS